MMKSFLTATAVAALLGFGATAAVAQQSAPLEVPTIQKSAPVDAGKVDAGKAAPGAVQNKAEPGKSGSTLHQGATAPTDSKAKRNTAATPADRKAKREAAAACGTIKDKAAHEACVTAHAKQQATKAPAVKSDQKATTPDKSKAAPRVGG